MDQLSYLTVFSNVAFLLPAWVLWYVGGWTFACEMQSFATIALVSATYHACDSPDLALCTTRFAILRFADLLVSYYGLVSLASPWVGLAFGPAWRLAWRMIGFTHVFYVVAWANEDYALAWVAPPCALALALSAWHVPAGGRSRWKWALVATVLAASAIAMVRVSSDDRADTTRYQLLHSFGSHLAQAGACAAVFACLPPATLQKGYTKL